MIFFENVIICGSSHSSALPILSQTSLLIGPRERIGILARPGSGKSTLARVFCGIEPPQSGHVETIGRLGWPLGYAGFLHPNLTVAENLVTISQLSDQDPTFFVARVSLLADLGAKLWSKMQDITPTERAVLAYMCAMSVPADIRVADDTLTVGGPEMRRRSDAMIRHHMRQGGLIYISRNPRQLRQYCTRFFALCHQQLIPCATPEIAETLLRKEQEFA